MMEDITFDSDGLTLSGVVHAPDDLKPGEKRPAIIVMHGFGGHKSGPAQMWSAPQYADWGYVAMRFDFRGCGDSEGARGLVTPQGQIADARAALAYMASRDDVDADRMGFSGTSYGAVVAVCATAADERSKMAIAQGGWGNGLNQFRYLHPEGAKWDTFQALIDEGKRRKAAGEEPLMAHRYDIIPLPEHLKANVNDPASTMDFQVETAWATLEFDPEDHVAAVAPRPLLLMHSAEDLVVPPEGSVELFRAADKAATELVILADCDHFMFGENNPRVIAIVRDWLNRYFPIT